MPVLGLGLTLTTTSAQASELVIRERLPKALPSLPKIDEVSPSPVAGLWAVRLGGQMLYVNSDASLLVDGQMVDLTTKANLTRGALDKALAVDFDTLPLRDAIVTFKHGSGARRLAVFADPMCGFCRRFEPMLAQLENVTVYTYLVAMLGPQAQDMSRRVLCAKDPSAAWSAWMLKGERPTGPAECEAATALLERNQALAIKLGVSGTPTTLLTDRGRLTGAVPQDALRAAVDKADAAMAGNSSKGPKASAKVGQGG